MDPIAAFDGIYRFCRLCQDTRREATVPLIQTPALVDAVKKFFNLKIRENDGLPQRICLKCESMLHLMIDFRREVEGVNQRLLHLLKQKQ